MPEERTTIRELARLSGVSVGTVSRALNGYADVRPETRERIIRLARELDYTPAAAARTLVTQRSHVIGVFLETGEGHPDLQHPFFHEVLGGLKGCIGAGGYDLLLFASERPGNGYGDHSYLKRCRHHNVDGAVLMGVDADDPEVRRLLRAELPCVGVDVEIEGARTAYVMSDNAVGAAAAVRHLHGLGHRRIATITGLLDKKPGIDRLRGYRDACRELGLGFRDEYVAYGDFYFEAGQQAAQRLLGLDEPPTAIFAASDMMAIGATRAAVEAGLRLPDELSIVGFDDMQLAAHVHPPLTTVAQDKAGLGVAAARALLREIEGAEPATPVTLPVELVVRRSSAAPAGG
jgi:LacI family transcriptional regulator